MGFQSIGCKEAFARYSRSLETVQLDDRRDQQGISLVHTTVHYVESFSNTLMNLKMNKPTAIGVACRASRDLSVAIGVSDDAWGTDGSLRN